MKLKFKRKTMLLVCLFCLYLSGCASNGAWEKTDTRLEVAFQVVNMIDAYTTMKIRHTEGIVETNWLTKALIGEQPVERDVMVLFVIYGISHYLIARALSPKWRRYYQVGTLGYSTSLVINNCHLGLCN